jgi:hypothetical protein
MDSYLPVVRTVTCLVEWALQGMQLASALLLILVLLIKVACRRVAW